MARVEFRQVEKRYGTVRAVAPIDLIVEDGELVVLLGPSGCGKTTLLRMVAGLETLSGGDLLIGGRSVAWSRPGERNVAMVFQNYALYPHLSVRENISFPLKVRKVPSADREQLVREAASTVGLEDYLDRLPRQLSGGQRQRVAVGRAIVRNPEVFLFDEPLSNLDAKLREDMRGEIIRLHAKIGKTTLYVTHDQVEAMTMAHRVVVMQHGVVQQVASPQDVFERPANVFVAGFIGSPTMNFMSGSVGALGTTLELGFASLPHLNGASPGRQITVGFRPHDGRLVPEAQSTTKPSLELGVSILSVQPLGHEVLLEVATRDRKWKGLVQQSWRGSSWKTDDEALLRVPFDALYRFDGTTGERIDC